MNAPGYANGFAVTLHSERLEQRRRFLFKQWGGGPQEVRRPRTRRPHPGRNAARLIINAKSPRPSSKDTFLKSCLTNGLNTPQLLRKRLHKPINGAVDKRASTTALDSLAL